MTTHGFSAAAGIGNPPSREWRISIHEAAHATIARLLRLPGCGQATLIEPGAHAVFPCNAGPRSIAALMAGACAEVALLGCDWDRAGNEVDAVRVWERLEKCGY